MAALATAGLTACRTLTTKMSPLTLKLEGRPKAALVSNNQLLVRSLRDDGERIQLASKHQLLMEAARGNTFGRDAFAHALIATADRDQINSSPRIEKSHRRRLSLGEYL
jgi:hypothetical protein